MKNRTPMSENAPPRRSLLAAACVVGGLLLSGKVAYEAGQSSQHDELRTGLVSANQVVRAITAPEVLKREIKDAKEVLADIETLNDVSPQKIESLNDRALVNTAMDVQGAVLDLSVAFNLNNSDVLRTLVSSQTLQTFKSNRVHFPFIEDGCVNPSATFKKDDTLIQAVLPLHKD